jgi:putative DNA primase/helicase
MNSDLQVLKERVNIVDIVGNYVTLKKKGAEHKGICPFHNDTKESLNVNEQKQLWFCPVCGDKSGDVFDFLTKKGFSWKQSIDIVKGVLGIEPGAEIEKKIVDKKKSKEPEWKHIRAVAECTDFKHYNHGLPAHVYPYRDSKGLVGYVCRYEYEGGKDTVPLIYAFNGISYQWRFLGFTNRPLYNADLIAANPKLPVVLVEGEKCADWLNARADNKFIATCWVGGSKAWQKSDFSILDGRRVVLWPDNDEPGMTCMTGIEQAIKSDTIKWVKIPDNMPKGWDCADSEWTPQQVQDYIRRFMKGPVEKKHKEDETYFSYLGFMKSDNQPVYCFYGKQSKTVFRFTTASMTRASLLAMVPNLKWWQDRFGEFKNVDTALPRMVDASYRVGIYSPNKIRGRGVWYDQGRIVIHAGDRLIVDGVDVALGDLDTEFIYEIGESFNFSTDNPLPDDKAKVLLKITRLLNWERGVNAELLAGWCVIAPICGALGWRPHLWLTGSAGSGKSWVFRWLVRRLLGETALDVQGSTTEAGLRQSLGSDAMPVVFDEIESQDAKSNARVQETLELARSASADDTGRIIKGSASHAAKEFQIRSCFAFSSITVGIDKSSDRRRVSVLSLVQPEDKEMKKKRWEELQTIYASTITDGFITGLHARTIKNLPVILANSKTFNDAVTKVLGTQAMGDQIGPMLAGAYSLQSCHLISMQDAEDYVNKQDWTEEAESESLKDELELLSNLLQWHIRVDGWGERQVAELVEYAAGLKRASSALYGGEQPGEMTGVIAQACLKRKGIRVSEKGFIEFSNESNEIKNRLKDTKWGKNYAKTLKRIPGSESGSSRFYAGTERCVKIPVKLIFG